MKIVLALHFKSLTQTSLGTKCGAHSERSSGNRNVMTEISWKSALSHEKDELVEAYMRDEWHPMLALLCEQYAFLDFEASSLDHDSWPIDVMLSRINFCIKSKRLKV